MGDAAPPPPPPPPTLPAKCKRSKNPQLILPSQSSLWRANRRQKPPSPKFSAPLSAPAAAASTSAADHVEFDFSPLAHSSPADSDVFAPLSATSAESAESQFFLTPSEAFGPTFTYEMATPPIRAKVIKLPIYEGKPGEHISDYIYTFQRIKKANNWTDDLALDYLKCNLRGYASDWLRRYEKIAANVAKTLPEFLDDMKSSLRAKSDAHMAERELYTRFQKKDENIRTFVNEMFKLFERADPDMSTKRKIQLIKNDMLEELVDKIGTPTTIEDLIDRAEDHTITRLVLRQRKKMKDAENSTDSEEERKIRRKLKKLKKAKRARSSSSSSLSSDAASSSSTPSEDTPKSKKKNNKKHRRRMKRSVETLVRQIAAIAFSRLPANMVPLTQPAQQTPQQQQLQYLHPQALQLHPQQSQIKILQPAPQQSLLQPLYSLPQQNN
jgi:hypothetical protein